MTTKSALSALLLALAATLPLRANSVPSLLSYQGHVTDAAGNAIGGSGAVNRTVTFRLYDTSSGGSVLYAESQTVTISAGEFSVLIGNGTGVSGSPGPSSPATTPYKSISDIVNTTTESNLYLGITVDDGNSGTVDAEISPRQQLVSGAFALRAKVAEAVASAAISSDMIGDSAVNTNQIHANAINSSKIADGAIVNADIANGTITSAKLDTSSVGFWTPSGANVYRASGNVGIGVSNPSLPLTFGNTLGNKISFWGNSASSNYGIGIQASTLQLYSDSAGADIAFGYGSSTNFTERMRIKGNGNVGIGSTNPGAKLDIASSVLLNGTAGRNHFKDSEKSDGAGLRVGTAWGMYGIYAETGPGVLGGSGGASIQNNSMFVSTNGNVGIGTAGPSSRLTVYEPNGTTHNPNSGTLMLQHGNNGGASSIVFRSAVNGGSDYGYIQYQDSSSIGAGGESAKLIIGTSNDGDDDLLLMPTGSVGIKTSNTAHGTVNIAGSLLTIGTHNNGSTAYARFRYADNGISMDVYNSNHNSGWRTALYNGDSNIDFYSDVRLKKNIEDAEPVLDRLLELRLRRFLWKNQPDDAAPEFGVIAQEVQPLFPDLVSSGHPADETEERMTVAYTAFGTIAVKAIQELHERNNQEHEALQAQIDEINRKHESELAARDARIASLEARLAAIEQALSSAK